jgi:hypothetical protein
MTSPQESGIKVLFISGASRSGSTILDNILGEIDGFFSAGELVYLWQRAIERRVCGCGRQLDECPIWGPVLEASLATPGLPVRADAVVALQRRTARLHQTFGLLARKSARPGSSLDALVGVLDAVYRTAAELTSARVIVDSSGRASSGALLRLVPGVQPFFVHIVRDPRGVVFSQRHPKPNPDACTPGAMEALHPARSCLYWSTDNIATEALCRSEPAASMRLRYEDFMLDPVAAVNGIAELVGEADVNPPFVGARRVDLGVNHTVSGNPSRFRSGVVELKHDERWVTQLSAADRRLTTGLLWPLMLRYDYPLTMTRVLAGR